jgi:uncharacterized protein (DUF1330 family)
MKNKKLVIVVGLALAALVGVFAYKYVTKNEVGLAETTADFTTSCDDIFKEFTTNKDASMTKYGRKTVAISGNVSSVEKAGENVTVIFKTTAGEGVVRCLLDTLDAPKLQAKNGDKLKLKGSYTGFEDDLMFVSVPELSFNRCVIMPN